MGLSSCLISSWYLLCWSQHLGTQKIPFLRIYVLLHILSPIEVPRGFSQFLCLCLSLPSHPKWNSFSTTCSYIFKVLFKGLSYRKVVWFVQYFTHLQKVAAFYSAIIKIILLWLFIFYIYLLWSIWLIFTFLFNFFFHCFQEIDFLLIVQCSFKTSFLYMLLPNFSIFLQGQILSNHLKVVIFI